MTIDDFDIIVSTTDSPLSTERRQRLTQYFTHAGITRYSFDEEPVCTSCPFPQWCAGWYGAGLHFANILKRAENRNIIYFEDDAILLPDFSKQLKRHLALLPNDWQIFVAGYTGIIDSSMVSENIVTASEFYGAQCIVIRNEGCRIKLADAVVNHDLYKHAIGFDGA